MKRGSDTPKFRDALTASGAVVDSEIKNEDDEEEADWWTKYYNSLPVMKTI